MGKYFSNKSSESDIAKYAKALNITDPRDLIACIEGTTSNTARQVIRFLYPPDKLLTMTGPEIPEEQRAVIRGNSIYLIIINYYHNFFNRIRRISKRSYR